ncbi:MAG: amidase [Chryseolinea sp.]
MKRRKFFRAGMAGIGVAAVYISGCKMPSGEASHVSTSVTTPASPFELQEADILSLQELMNSGKYTSRSICEAYLKRIELVDRSGPMLNTIIELNPDALSLADALDKERKGGKVRGYLHGIPVLVKDNIDTGDKMMTTAGALAMVGNVAAKDAFIVAQLRKAGAVILGKTNLSEWANFRANRSSSGWSSRGGQTKNPYILDRNPCGSSSGSGAAASANLCAITIGTETNGSIACPSSINGIVGLKPTVGLVSRSGIIPISQTQDTAGPMTRTVTDAAILLSAIVGVDQEDPVTKESEGKVHADYTKFLEVNGLAGKRIGVEKSMLKGHEGVDKLLLEALDTMKSKGATIVEIDLISKVKEIGSSEFTVLQFEFKDGLNRYLSKAKAPVKSLQEVIDYNLKNEAKAMPFFKQDILESAQRKGGLDSIEYQTALKKILDISRGALNVVMKSEKLDAICGPTNGPSWCTDLVNGDTSTGYGIYGSAAIAGYPHITVPMGLTFGLPIGLSFIGLPYSEPSLLTLAFAYEQASQKRTVPEFKSIAILQ